jgi:hypothetical protein
MVDTTPIRRHRRLTMLFREENCLRAIDSVIEE